jgi:hypothetical protein
MTATDTIFTRIKVGEEEASSDARGGEEEEEEKEPPDGLGALSFGGFTSSEVMGMFFFGREGRSAVPFWQINFILPASPAPFMMEPLTSKTPDFVSGISANSSR